MYREIMTASPVIFVAIACTFLEGNCRATEDTQVFARLTMARSSPCMGVSSSSGGTANLGGKVIVRYTVERSEHEKNERYKTMKERNSYMQEIDSLIQQLYTNQTLYVLPAFIDRSTRRPPPTINKVLHKNCHRTVFASYVRRIQSRHEIYVSAILRCLKWTARACRALIASSSSCDAHSVTQINRRRVDSK